MDGILHRRMLGAFLLNCVLISNLQAGGSGFNTVVVVNQSSSNSCELGNYFCERRGIPPENLLRISWSGGNTVWSSGDFQTNLVTPLLEMLAARQLSNQIDYVVLSMDIPFQTGFGSTLNGTTSALFYGLKSGGGSDPGVTNSYAASEAVFRYKKPASAPGYSFLATMITADSLAQAERLVDQGVASDGKCPLQPVVLAKSSDPDRNVRFRSFDNAIFNVKVRGTSSIERTNSDSLCGQTGFLGYETGLFGFSLAPDTFIPGAMADSLTSFGGVIFGPNDQTNLLAFIAAGAAGSYGTVSEPANDPQKFPDPQDYFYQARGFTLAESYYQSLNAPFLGLIVAEPLAAPFARPGSGRWSAGISNSVLSASSMLSVQFSSAFGQAPLQQVDLFVDGVYFSTLTNLAPCAGNELTVALNGFLITYTVPTNASAGSVATGLAALLNTQWATNATKVIALAHGDRIELQSAATNPLALPFYVADTISTNSSASYSVHYLPDSFPPRLIPMGLDKNGVFTLEAEMPTALPGIVQASTNLVDWIPIFTNSEAGLPIIQDIDSRNYPTRFYRMVGVDPSQPPKLQAMGIDPGGAFQMHLESLPNQPCAVLVSTNLINWTPLLTNQSGGALDLLDAGASNSAARFYRARLASPAPPAFTVLSGSNGSTVVRVDSALQPYTVVSSGSEGQSTVLVTNFGIGEIQTSTASAIGAGSTLSTFLSASRPRFLDSEALGRQRFNVRGSSLPSGAWLRFTITTTDSQAVVLAVTNQTDGAGPDGPASQLCGLINSNPCLQGSHGVEAADFLMDTQTGTASFNLYARTPGYQAAAIAVQPKAGHGLTVLPSSQQTLKLNASDLQPRNHLYVTAGAASLAVTFPLDTTMLADGYHQLTAVAYEGSHVRTQTRTTAPVRVQNSSLTASLALLDLPATAPVQGTYHLQAAASASNVTAITLFSTGGALETITNQASPTFTVPGSSLGVGLHPFYAIIQTSSGLKYRTQTQWSRLVH